MSKPYAVYLLAAVIGVFAFVLSDRQFVPGASTVTSAEARVGRPLTPMSVAGVARRTARRCAAGVYYC
jgi:hypothetical protein